MKAYFTALLFSAVAGGISAAVAAKPYQKHLRFLSSLICLALIVAPFVNLAPEIKFSPPSAEEDYEYSYDLAAEQAAEDAATALQNYIFAQTGVKTEDVGIDMERVEGQLYIRGVRVKVPEQHHSAVKHCLDELLGDTVKTEVYW